MIVSIGLGDDGVHVTVDDEIVDYNPLRTVELCNAARRLFFEAWRDTLTDVTPDAVEQ